MGSSDVRVNADWVQAHLHVPGVVLIEVGEGTAAYDKGHIQGAVKIDLADLQDPARCDQARFEGLLSERGIASDDTVILYSGSNRVAAYTYWYFRSHGHPNVRLLDGGRKRWERDSRAFVTEIPHRPRTAYRVQGTAGPRIATWPWTLVRGVWNTITKPADQALRAASAPFLAVLTAVVSSHEDLAVPCRPGGPPGQIPAGQGQGLPAPSRCSWACTHHPIEVE